MSTSHSANAPTDGPIIDAAGLVKKFGTTVAVDHLDLQVHAGEVFGLVGPDGAGKTTTMRLLAGISRADAGTARVVGLDVRTQAAAVSDRIGYMSQRFGLYADLTVEENIRFYADIYDVPRKQFASRLGRVLEFSQLGTFLRRRAANLSGGMKQKLSLACALIHEPQVLLLDEPTNGVDPVSRRDFWRILYQLVREGVTIFVSTAYLDEAERCNRVALMHQGKLLACDTPPKVKALIPGQLVEVATDRPRETYTLLRAAWPDRSVGLFGSQVHVVLQDASVAGDEVAAQLATSGIRIEHVRTIVPSLEDVFVAVLADPQAPQEVA
ncbi:MAG: ATP-binding cassette domain-containing protein [Planctomycetota bacterium]